MCDLVEDSVRLFGKRNTDQARHDMQSMSEVWGLEATRGQTESKNRTSS